MTKLRMIGYFGCFELAVIGLTASVAQQVYTQLAAIVTLIVGGLVVAMFNRGQNKSALSKFLLLSFALVPLVGIGCMVFDLAHPRRFRLYYDIYHQGPTWALLFFPLIFGGSRQLVSLSVAIACVIMVLFRCRKRKAGGLETVLIALALFGVLTIAFYVVWGVRWLRYHGAVPLSKTQSRRLRDSPDCIGIVWSVDHCLLCSLGGAVASPAWRGMGDCNYFPLDGRSSRRCFRIQKKKTEVE